MDKDNALSEEEFCVAMKLVLLRRKGYYLPTSIPLSLRDSVTTGEAGLSSQSNYNTAVPPEPRRKLGSLQTSHTVGDLPVSSLPPPEDLLVDVTDPSDSGLPDSSPASNNYTTVERGEPAVATIISLGDDDEGSTSDKDTSKSGVRRALSLKHFSPPPERGHASPPASPFSPAASTETAPIIISLQNPSPKVHFPSSDGLLSLVFSAAPFWS